MAPATVPAASSPECGQKETQALRSTRLAAIAAGVFKYEKQFTRSCLRTQRYWPLLVWLTEFPSLACWNDAVTTTQAHAHWLIFVSASMHTTPCACALGKEASCMADQGLLQLCSIPAAS